MAAGKLSPRQKMINMMYLVLTALLALNVSKEVLNSFFEVNLGIERSTTNFNAKNGDTYAAFDAAAELNKVKAGPFRDQAYEVKANADELVEFIQEMKYNLVLAADNKVYLGSQLELKDEDGDFLHWDNDEKVSITRMGSGNETDYRVSVESNQDEDTSEYDIYGEFGSSIDEIESAVACFLENGGDIMSFALDEYLNVNKILKELKKT